jgi:tetratricopeptide (TPR) repeat protein
MRRVSFLVPLALFALSVVAAAQYAPRQSNPNGERARKHYLSGWEHMRAEEFDQAAGEFRSAIELNPKFAIAYFSLGRAYQNLHRYSEAVQALTTSRDLYEAQASAKFNSQMEADRYRQDRLLELQDMRSQILKGPQSDRTQNSARQVDDAIRQTNEEKSRGTDIAIENPVPSFVSLSLGSALFRAERLQEAEIAYKAAIKADQKAGEAHNNLAVLYLMQSRYTDAMTEVMAAEKNGFRVNPELKDEIRTKMGQ